ncbi:MAG TPA: hypothetical protein VN756_04445 [Solirubrobacterales bacterium]|nr:hypothetical protein [Solirubrobacterales bacterium]
MASIIAAGEGSQPLRRRRTDNVLRRVCANCNSGWMSQLEGGVRPLLKPLIAGETIRVSAPERELLLRSALKTAAVLGPVQRAPDAVSLALRRRLAEGSDLGQDVALWAVPLAPDERDADDWRFGLDVDDSPEAPAFNISGIPLGGIAFEVVNLNHPEKLPFERLPRLIPSLYQRVAPPALGPALLPSPTTAASTAAAAGVPFRMRLGHAIHLALKAGMKPALPMR